MQAHAKCDSHWLPPKSFLINSLWDLLPAFGCTNRDLLVIQIRQDTVLAGVLPGPHVSDGHCSDVENRVTSPPDRLWSRITRGRGTRPHRADHSLYERMRKRHVRNSLDFRHLEHPKFGLPLARKDLLNLIPVGSECSGHGEQHLCRSRCRKPTRSADQCSSSPSRDTPFHCYDVVKEVFLGSLRTRSMPALGRKQQAVLSFLQHG